MGKSITPLTDTQVKRAKCGAKLAKMFDGDGLYLELHPNGSKLWRFRYKRSNNKEQLISFGKYPEVSLADARHRRAEARRLLRDGVDPLNHRESQRRQKEADELTVFEQVAREWHKMKAKSWTAQYAANVLHRFECDIFPEIGKLRITEVTHRDLIAAFRKIEQRGAHEIAKRNKAVCGQIFSYAVQVGAANRNPVADMKDVLQAVSPGHFPAISVDGLPDFIAAMKRSATA